MLASIYHTYGSCGSCNTPSVTKKTPPNWLVSEDRNHGTSSTPHREKDPHNVESPRTSMARISKPLSVQSPSMMKIPHKSPVQRSAPFFSPDFIFRHVSTFCVSSATPLPSGKRLHNYGKSPYFSYVNQRSQNGHVKNRKL